MIRLSDATAATLPAEVTRFTYDRAAVRIGVVHLGLDAFHQAHQALLFDDALNSGDLRWGIRGVSLHGSAVRDALLPQDCLFTVTTRGTVGTQRRLVGALRDVLVAPEDPAAVVAALADANVHLVTLTVHESGYRFGEAGLDWSDPDVAHDVAEPGRPRTAVGFVVAGLAARRAAGLLPFTTMSCDDICDSGGRLRDAAIALAQRNDPCLAAWIARHAAFPSSMVDRIVPVATADDRAEVAQAIGLEDAAATVAEPFWQWVVQNHFCAPRPDFARFGATLVEDATPWQLAKLRLLKSAHSAVAYLGGLAGVAFVHEFVGEPACRAYLETLWNEAVSTLPRGAGMDLAGYRAALIPRLSNPALRQAVRQIAADGSQKIPPRLIAVIAERAARGLPSPATKLAIAAWMRWQTGVDDTGSQFPVDDPLAPLTAPLAIGPAERVVSNMLALPAIFPPAFAYDAARRRTLVSALDTLTAHGVQAALARWPETPVLTGLRR